MYVLKVPLHISLQGNTLANIGAKAPPNAPHGKTFRIYHAYPHYLHNNVFFFEMPNPKPSHTTSFLFKNKHTTQEVTPRHPTPHKRTNNTSLNHNLSSTF